jgi:hypothetical protein
MLGLEDRLRSALDEDKRVVGILKNRAGCIGYKRVVDGEGQIRVVMETVKNISHDDKKIRR